MIKILAYAQILVCVYLLGVLTAKKYKSKEKLYKNIEEPFVIIFFILTLAIFLVSVANLLTP